jgi:hypothetical protein
VEQGLCQEPAPECSSDAQCGARHCLLPQGRCVDCFQPAHCGQGVTCDATAHVCLVPCQDDDSSEPNNTLALAASLQPGSTRSGTLCPADVDYVRVVLGTASDLSAVMTVGNGGGQAAMELQDVSGNLLTLASLAGGALSLTQAAVAAGTYHLRLSSTGSTPIPYTLTAALGGTAGCTQEAGEPNDLPATATPLTPDGNARGGALCAGDVDHYALTAAAGDRVRAVAAGQGGAAVELTLLDGAGATVATGSPLQTDALAAGPYVLRLRSTNGTITPYTLAVSVSAGPPPCRQTDAEPNNTAAQAQASVVDGTAMEGAVCPGDVDRYRVVASLHDRLTATLALLPGSGAGPLSLQLLDASDTEVTTTTSGTFTVPNLTAGRYFVAVVGNTANEQGAYRLSLTLEPGQPSQDPCQDNGLEPNNTSAQATPITLGGSIPARICPMDEDRYAFAVSSAEVVRVSTAFHHANGDLDLSILDAAGGVVASSAGVSDAEVVEVLLQPGDYVVRVYGFRDATNPYVLTTAVASCAGDDELEENDTPRSPTHVGPASISAVRCPGDDDYFAVKLNAGDGVTAGLTGTGLSLELLDADATLLSSGMAVTATGAAAGTLLLRVTGANTSNVSYQLDVEVTPGDGRVCTDDAAEEDDDINNARAVGGVSLANGDQWLLGNACSGDEDWFTVDVNGPTRVVADLVFDPAAADLDLALRERQGFTSQTRSVVASNGTQFQERIEGTVPAGTNIPLQVRRYSGPEGTPYVLKVHTEALVVADGGCVEDLVDSVFKRGADGGVPGGRDDTFSSAVVLSADGDRAEARAICADNVDYYQVYVRTGQKLTVDVRYTYATGHDLDTKVFKPSAPDTAVAFGVSSDDDEHVEYTAVEDGYHRVEVYGYSGGTNTYTLSVSVL